MILFSYYRRIQHQCNWLTTATTTFSALSAALLTNNDRELKQKKTTSRLHSQIVSSQFDFETDAKYIVVGQLFANS